MRKKRQKVKFREKWRKLWSVEKKIHFVMLTVIISLTLIAIIVSTVFLTNALTEQNRQYASEQLGIMASDCEGNLEQYKALMIATVLDDSIQEYCRSESLQTADKVSDNVWGKWFMKRKVREWQRHNLMSIRTSSTCPW